MKTRAIKQNDLKIDWYVVDADGIRLGNLASKIAKLLLGKGKVANMGNIVGSDNVIVINAKKVSVYPKKKDSKKYYRHSGYIGSLKEETLGDLLKRRPEEVIRRAVDGMLPRNKLRQKMLRHLFIYSEEEHKHQAQNPTKISIE